MVPVPSSPGGSDISSPQSSVDFTSGYQGFQLQGDALAVGWDLLKVIISSLSRSRIDPYTYYLFNNLGKSIPWSVDGKRKFENAIKALEGRGTAFWNMFLFGFNMQGPVRHLLEHPHAQRFAALSACLSAVYQDPVVAQILMEFLQIMSSKGDVQLPPLSTVMSLVERFSGILVADDFSTGIEDVMSLDGQDSVTGTTQPSNRRTAKKKPPPVRSRADPRNIAEALSELIQLCGDNPKDRKTSRLILRGGADAIVIAYIGSWLMDLPFAIYKASFKGNAIYKSHPTAEMPFVIVELLENTSHSQDTQVQLKERIVHLNQISELMKDTRKTKMLYPVLGGRCKWSNVLEKTFGAEFRKLLRMTHEFGRAIGSAARIFEAVAKGEEEVDFEWRLEHRTYYTSSYGKDYVNDGFKLFTELRSNQKLENTSREYSQTEKFEDAYGVFEAAMRKTADECKCKLCGFNITTTSSSGAPAKSTYCRPTLICTIILLIRILSGVDLHHETLYPTRAGIEHVYDVLRQQHQRRRQTLSTHNNKKDEGYITLILDGLKKDKAIPRLSQLALVHMIFSGENMQDRLTKTTSAYESEGICSYYQILGDESRDAKQSSRVGVNVGLIEYATRKGDSSVTNRFSRIIDTGEDPYSVTVRHAKSQNGPGIWVHESTMSLAQKCAGRRMPVVVHEHLGDQRIPYLQVGFEVLDDDNKPCGYLGPAKVIENLIIGSGLVPAVECTCSRTDAVATILQQTMPSRSPRDASIKFDYDGTTITVFRGDSSTARIAAWGCWQPIFLPNSNCVSCAVHLGVQRSWSNFAVVCPEHSYDWTESDQALEFHSSETEE